MNVALYARVSTSEQDPEVQLAPLRTHTAQRGWAIIEEFVDRGFSGAKERRPALDRLMRAAWAGQFQAILVWRFLQTGGPRMLRMMNTPSGPMPHQPPPEPSG